MAFDYAYGQTTLSELELHGVRQEETGEFQLTGATFEGQLVIPSQSFVKALCERFAISQHIQNNRTSGELLQMLVRSFPKAQIKYRIEWDESGTTWLFPCQPSSGSVSHDPTTTQPAADIPSPESRLAMYGFKPSQQPHFDKNKIDNDQDWPLLRSSTCHVPTFPVLPGEPGSQHNHQLFIDGPAGTPRPSVN